MADDTNKSVWERNDQLASKISQSNLLEKREHIESKMGFIAISVARLKKANESFEQAQTRVLREVSQKINRQLKSKLQSLYFDHNKQTIHFTTRIPEHVKALEDFQFEVQNVTYRTVPRKTPYLLITIDVYDNVLDSEIIDALKEYGSIVGNVTHCTHSFDHTLFNGKRKLQFKPKGKVTDIPHFIKLNGINTQLYFKGKVFKCKNCNTKHVVTEPCPPSKESESEKEHVKTPQAQNSEQAPFTFIKNGAVLDEDAHPDDQSVTSEVFPMEKPTGGQRAGQPGEQNRDFDFTSDSEDSLESDMETESISNQKTNPTLQTEAAKEFIHQMKVKPQTLQEPIKSQPNPIQDDHAIGETEQLGSFDPKPMPAPALEPTPEETRHLAQLLKAKKKKKNPKKKSKDILHASQRN